MYESLNFGFHVGDDPAAVIANRALLGATQFMNQVHGNEVVVIDHVLDQEPTCDALITTTKGISLAVMVADCIPLLLISDAVVGAVHVGRAGLIKGIVEATIARLISLGSKVNDISAALGPSICGNCYEVSPEIYLDVIAKYPATATNLEKHCLDLPAGVISILDSYEIDYSRENSCTAHGENLFSYRRDGITGRQSGVIAW